MPARQLRIALLAAAILFTTNGPLLFFASRVLDRPGFPPRWEDAFVRPAFIAFAVVTVVLVVRHHTVDQLRADLGSRALVVGAVAVFPLWALTSTVWSEQPDLTFWRSCIYVGLAFLAIAVAALDDRGFVGLVLLATGLAVAASVIVVVARPDISFNHEVDWQGVYTNPNSLGPIAALALIGGVGWWGQLRTDAARVAMVAALGAGALTLYQTSSRTSWFALAIALGSATGVTVTRRIHARLGSRRAIAIVAPLVALGGTAFAAVLALRWDEPTLSQRRTIWSGSWEFIDDRWAQGYGFFSFFEVPGRATAAPFFDRGSAHSSFVEVLLGLGVLGLLLFVVVLSAALVNSVRGAWRSPGLLSWARLAIVVVLVFENVTESFVLWFSYNWVILCAAALRSPSTITKTPASARTSAGSPRRRSTPR